MPLVRRSPSQNPTLVIIFTNDNGGGGNNTAVHTRNTTISRPYRGHKFDVWEGGVRVPFIMRWPGQLPAGQTFDGIVSTVNELPIFTDAASASVPGNLDGVDLMLYVQGEKTGHPQESLCWQQRVWVGLNERRPGGSGYPTLFYNLAIRCDDWKAIKLDQPFDGTDDSRAWELYDLSRDPAELNDLATEFTEKVSELSTVFFTWRKQIPTPVLMPAATTTPMP